MAAALAAACPRAAAPQTPAPPAPATSPSQGADHESLAKKLQNPFADLISVPFQNIYSGGIGPGDGSGNVLNIQPVVPLHVNARWNLLLRPILPISYTSVPASETGLGDFNFEPFLSPRDAGSTVWGLGAILGAPTATGDYLGTGRWTAGPSLALFTVHGHWTVSAIINQQWSFAGDAARDAVSLLQVQPSVSYILKQGWFLTSGPLIAADWTEPAGQKWTVPVGAGIGRVFSVRGQKINLQAEAYGNVVRPDNGPKRLILLTATLLFPE